MKNIAGRNSKNKTRTLSAILSLAIVPATLAMSSQMANAEPTPTPTSTATGSSSASSVSSDVAEVSTAGVDKAQTALADSLVALSQAESEITVNKSLAKTFADEVQRATVEELKKTKELAEVNKAIAAYARNSYVDTGNNDGFGQLTRVVVGGPSVVADISREEQTSSNVSEQEATTAAKKAQEAEDAAQTRINLQKQYEETIKAQAALEQAKVLAEQKVTDARVNLTNETNKYETALTAALIGKNDPQVEIAPNGCPKTAPAGTLRDGAESIGAYALCSKAVKGARTPQAAAAIMFAFSKLGSPYSQADRNGSSSFDCSSLVARAYNAGGVTEFFSSTPNTAGYANLPAFIREVPTKAGIMPGDIVILYGTTIADSGGNAGHAQMAIGDDYIIQSGGSGDSRVNVSKFPNWPGWKFTLFKVKP